MTPAFPLVLSVVAVVLATLSVVKAESHTISFSNKCGHGTPTLIIGGNIVSTGKPYTSSHTISGIAYLQTGPCLYNGENCALVEMTLNNPTCPGCGSSADISLISPHAYNVETSFSYYNGCDGQGATCDSPNCKTAFFTPDDNWVQVACQTPDVNLLITFCGSSGAQAPKPATALTLPTPSEQVVSSALVAATPTNDDGSGALAVSASSAAPSPSVSRTSCNAKRDAIAARNAQRDLTARTPRMVHRRRRTDSFGGVF
ncbi:hypothetical protein BC835DRAFT_1346216 [Cytidiella melzeri]|nr:hypothetical protein BC835DRAFT_1346216 [Cytidiella melzeri]